MMNTLNPVMSLNRPSAPKFGAQSGSKVVAVSEADFQREVIEASKTQPVVVDFFAPWCGPCRKLAPVLDDLSANRKYTDKVKFVKINTDENGTLANAHGIVNIPTMVVFNGGQEVARIVGPNVAQLQRELRGLI